MYGIPRQPSPARPGLAVLYLDRDRAHHRQRTYRFVVSIVTTQAPAHRERWSVERISVGFTGSQDVVWNGTVWYDADKRGIITLMTSVTKLNRILMHYALGSIAP